MLVRGDIMKSKNRAALAVTTVAVLLSSCGVSPDQNVASSEMAAPEVSSQELLISSLEYLLLDDTGGDVQDPSQRDSQDQQTEAQDPPAVEEESVDTPDAQPEEDDIREEEAIIYYGNGAFSDLEQETVEVAEITPDELISALARHNIVSLDTKVLSFELGEQDGALILYLDLSKSVSEYLRTMSMEAESIIVASVINTFLDNYDADAVFLTVEGKTLITSNAEYSRQLVRCTPGELMETLQIPDGEESDGDTGKDTAGGDQSKLPLVVEKE